MTPYYETSRFTLYEGDCRIVLPSLANCSIDSIVCDPPYALTNRVADVPSCPDCGRVCGGSDDRRVGDPCPVCGGVLVYRRTMVGSGFMGKSWDTGLVAFSVEVWRECLRVLKPGGHLLAFGGSRTYHRLACAVEDAGFEIRDQIMWLYGQGFPKSLDVSKAIDAAAGAEREVIGANPYNARRPNAPVSDLCQQAGWPSDITAPATDAAKQWSGWGTALKPAHEPIVLARKPLIGTVAQNTLEHGTGGLNIAGCRVGDNGGCVGAGEGPTNGIFRDGLNGSFAQPVEGLGRWPANVIHDGSDEVLAAFPDAPGQQGDLNGHSKDRLSKGIFGDMKAARDAIARLDSGSAARFFYCAKSSQEDRTEGLEDLPLQNVSIGDQRPSGSMSQRIHKGEGRPDTTGRNPHPTVKPTQLMRYLCRLVTPQSGIVLDPFCGSGSTGRGAMLEGLRFIGIELSTEYCELARRRIQAVTKQGLLFT